MNHKENPIDKIKLLKGTIAEVIIQLRYILPTLPRERVGPLDTDVLYPLEEVLNFPTGSELDTIIAYKRRLGK